MTDEAAANLCANVRKSGRLQIDGRLDLWQIPAPPCDVDDVPITGLDLGPAAHQQFKSGVRESRNASKRLPIGFSRKTRVAPASPPACCKSATPRSMKLGGDHGIEIVRVEHGLD